MKLHVEDVFAVLVVLSFSAFLVGYLELFSGFFAIFLVISTFLKGQLISDYFMDLREVDYKYRLIPTLWLVVVLSLIGVAYMLPISA
jgi:hypothetical protein